MVFIYITECNPLPIQDDHPAVSVIRSGDPLVKIPSPNCLDIPLETLKVFSFWLLWCGIWKKFVNQQEEVIWILKKFVNCCKTPLLFGDGGTNDEKSESMGDSCSDESSGCVGSTVCDFGKGHVEPFIGKDNNNSKGGDELSQGFLQGIEPSRLVVVAYDNVFHKDQTMEIAFVFFFKKKKNIDHTLAFVFCFVVNIIIF